MKSLEVLKEKLYKNYNYISRYSGVPFYFNKLDNKYIYGITYPMNKNNTYLTHKVLRNENLDSLSLIYYNTPLYFWVIADFNDILDPFLELKEGMELKIPTLSNVSFETDK